MAQKFLSLRTNWNLHTNEKKNTLIIKICNLLRKQIMHQMRQMYKRLLSLLSRWSAVLFAIWTAGNSLNRSDVFFSPFLCCKYQFHWSRNLSAISCHKFQIAFTDLNHQFHGPKTGFTIDQYFLYLSKFKTMSATQRIAVPHRQCFEEEKNQTWRIQYSFTFRNQTK